MFERYTEEARRVIFFARHEASEFGSSQIETEHILLGLMRADNVLLRLIPNFHFNDVRKRIESLSPVAEKIPISVDLPLSNEGKRVLDHAAEEAERLGSKPITPAHLLLGLLREKRSPAASILHDYGVKLSELRLAVAELPPTDEEGTTMVMIHGRSYPSGYIESAVTQAQSFFWNHRKFVAPDIVVHRGDKRISFDLKLSETSPEFELVKGGWKENVCKICAWEFAESDDAERGSGYTNGRDWVCRECHEKFLTKPPV